MIVRDEAGIIIQHPLDKNSGGDSARSCGMMAISYSAKDLGLMWKFEKPQLSGKLSRHPLHYPNDSFTRDQLLPTIAGIHASGDLKLARRVFWSHAKRGFFCQNYMEQFPDKHGFRRNKGFFGRDPLSPSHIGHLILCAELYWLYPFVFLFGLPWLICETVYHAKCTPRGEPNQLISMLKTYDLVWLWVYLHPNWRTCIRDYWSGWRDQKEIAEQIIDGIEHDLERL
jgi:hypothetical protein